MYVCMYVCLYVCMYVCVYVCMYACVYVYTRTHAWIQVYLYVYMLMASCSVPAMQYLHEVLIIHAGWHAEVLWIEVVDVLLEIDKLLLHDSLDLSNDNDLCIKMYCLCVPNVNSYCSVPCINCQYLMLMQIVHMHVCVCSCTFLRTDCDNPSPTGLCL
jgi:hypothetical protein